MSREELEKLVVTLEEEMLVAAEELRFEYAAKLRDEIKELRRELTWQFARAESGMVGDPHALQRRAAGTERGAGRAPVRPEDQRLPEAVGRTRPRSSAPSTRCGVARARLARDRGARG